MDAGDAPFICGVINDWCRGTTSAGLGYKPGCEDNELSEMWSSLKPEETAASAIKSEAEQIEIWEGQVWKTFQISSA